MKPIDITHNDDGSVTIDEEYTIKELKEMAARGDHIAAEAVDYWYEYLRNTTQEEINERYYNDKAD